MLSQNVFEPFNSNAKNKRIDYSKNINTYDQVPFSEWR